MNRVNVELRDGTPVELDVPEGVERSCFGALRLYPQIPRAISREELEWIRRKAPAVAGRLIVSPYVASKRRDIRGVSEEELLELAAKEGISHLSPKRQLEVLRDRKKLPARSKLPKVTVVSPTEEKPKSKTSK